MTPPTDTAIPKVCTNCSCCTVSFLHNIRLRGIYRCLCTSCVLRLHPTSFCPSCFQVHNPAPPLQLYKYIICSKCNSISHSHCIPSPRPPTPYRCPPCSDPNYVFFDIDNYPPSVPRTVDKKKALVLLCASKIASISMEKAVVVARANAERKIREAVNARRDAKEALVHVAELDEIRRKQDKEERKEEEEEEEEFEFIKNVESSVGSTDSTINH